MKEIPILFSTEMVKAIIEGRKTQTRRIIKPQPPGPSGSFPATWRFSYWGGSPFKDPEKKDPEQFRLMDGMGHVFIPDNNYGKPGDRLWVRETWGWGPTGKGQVLVYKATHEGPMHNKWHPSIHMHKESARIWLEVEEVRVQRLQDIGHQDAVDEGILREWDGTKYWYQDYTKGAQGMVTVSQLSYKSLWQSINGPESWEQNPFVWVIKFKRV